jgi:hypothetical protein
MRRQRGKEEGNLTNLPVGPSDGLGSVAKQVHL